jgi:CHAT domain-containing protein
MVLHAQLVVLSACETGAGQYVAGEGVFSLARGFMDAGVPSVVMSLWQVNDISTSELMPLFYRHLAQGLPKDEALHKAKLEFLKTSDPMKTHPFFWAGFVLLGDNAPVKEGESRWYIWMGLGLFLAIGGYWGFRILRP